MVEPYFVLKPRTEKCLFKNKRVYLRRQSFNCHKLKKTHLLNLDEGSPIVVTKVRFPFYPEFDLPNKTYQRISTDVSKTTGATCGTGYD